jgi:hypothetical protein
LKCYAHDFFSPLLERGIGGNGNRTGRQGEQEETGIGGKEKREKE